MISEQLERAPLTAEQRRVYRQKRRESRASATYHQFLKDLRTKGFNSEAQAERAATAVLCALEQRLTKDQVFKFESQLPSKLRDLIVHCERHDEQTLLPRYIGRPEFLAIVASDLGNSEMDVTSVTRLVFETLAQHVTAGEIHKVIHHLPGDLRELWPEWARAAEEHRPTPTRQRPVQLREPAPEVVDFVFELPLRSQLGVLRTIAPQILSQLRDDEREGFMRDLNAEINRALNGEPTYDLRRSDMP